MLTATAAAAALSATVRTWGVHRRTPRGVDVLGRDAVVGATLEHLGLADLIPAVATAPRTTLSSAAKISAELTAQMSPAAVELLDYACDLDRAAYTWGYIARAVRAHAVNNAAMRDAS